MASTVDGYRCCRPDGGAGGKYVVLPPDFQGQPPAGHFAVRSPTYGVFVFLRAFLTDGETGPGVELLEQSRIYPLSEADDPRAMEFPIASGLRLDVVFPRVFD